VRVKPPPDSADHTFVAQDPAESTRTMSCPSCGAALRPGSPWCTLCYADLRPVQPAAAMPAGVPTTPPLGAAYGPSAPDPLTQPLLDFISAPPTAVPEPEQAGPEPVAAAGWPCVGCGSVNPLDASTCAACGKGFLAGVAETPSLRVPLFGDLTRLTRAQRLWGATAVAAVLAVVLVLLLALVVLIIPG
jgi:hypothetical protein